MKNINIKLQGIFSMVLLLIVSIAYAQPPRICDTCKYDVELTKGRFFTDSVDIYTPPQTTSEFSPCPASDTGLKYIGFIHGLSGSPASWSDAQEWTSNNYKTNSGKPSYVGWETSFHDVGQEVNKQIEVDIHSKFSQTKDSRCYSNDFIIAHSQGGIGSRYLDYKWDTHKHNTDFGDRRLFYGLVTFGSPHGGAHIALTKDQHAGFITGVVDAIYLEGTYNLRGYSKKLDKLLDNKDIFIEEEMVPIMIKGLHTNTMDAMAPNSSVMDSINNHKSRLHKVAFYGVEDAPECWRVISNMTDVAAEDYPTWKAEPDNFFVDKAESVRAEHLAAIQENNSKIKRWKAAGIFGRNIFSALMASYFVNKNLVENHHREEAVRFLDNANTHWRYLIGAYHRDSFEWVNETYYELTWEEKYGWLGKWYKQTRHFNTYNECVNHYNGLNVYRKQGWSINAKTKPIKKQSFYPNDGVVLVKSQKAFPGVGGRIDKMEKNNHFQERNSPQTEEVLEKLYKGKYDGYFTTLRKR